MSVFWRVNVSAWLGTTELQPCRKRLPKCVFGSLNGLTAEETAMLLQAGQALVKLTIRMSPEISKVFPTSLGWDEGLCSLWALAWTAQQRYVQWQDTTVSEPLVALDATPQGCPMAPLVLCYWIAAGCKHVVHSAGLPSQLLQAAYMDDRTAISQT